MTERIEQIRAEGEQAIATAGDTVAWKITDFWGAVCGEGREKNDQGKAEGGRGKGDRPSAFRLPPSAFPSTRPPE